MVQHPTGRYSPPCDRRIDGSKVTEFVPAAQWFDQQANSSAYNHFKRDNKGHYPPSLPRGMSRDHITEMHRKFIAVDNGMHGKDKYVQVTRRRMASPEQEAAARRCATEQLRLHEQRMARDAAEARELMELRSLGIRAIVRGRASAAQFGPGSIVVPPANARAEELHKRLLSAQEAVADSASALTQVFRTLFRTAPYLTFAMPRTDPLPVCFGVCWKSQGGEQARRTIISHITLDPTRNSRREAGWSTFLSARQLAHRYLVAPPQLHLCEEQGNTGGHKICHHAPTA